LDPSCRGRPEMRTCTELSTELGSRTAKPNCKAQVEKRSTMGPKLGCSLAAADVVLPGHPHPNRFDRVPAVAGRQGHTLEPATPKRNPGDHAHQQVATGVSLLGTFEPWMNTSVPGAEMGTSDRRQRVLP
jgi:hypothetical protein